MSNKQLAALLAAVLAVGAIAGIVWGLLTMADLIDRAEQERWS
jgi:hypothetical protein